MNRNKLLLVVAIAGAALVIISFIFFLQAATSTPEKPKPKAKVELPVAEVHKGGESSAVTFTTEEDLPVVVSRTPPDVTPQGPNPYEYPTPIRPAAWLVATQMMLNDGYDISYPKDWTTQREDLQAKQIFSIYPQTRAKTAPAPGFTITSTRLASQPSRQYLEELGRPYEALGFVRSRTTVNTSAPLTAIKWTGTLPASQSPSGKALQQTLVAVYAKRHEHQIMYTYEGDQKNDQMEKFFEYMLSTIKFK